MNTSTSLRIRIALSMTVIGGGFVLFGGVIAYALYAFFTAVHTAPETLGWVMALVIISVITLVSPAAVIFASSARQRIMRDADL